MAMAAKRVCIAFALELLILNAAVQARKIAIYWGQHGNEGSLSSACNSGHYDIIMLSFLYQFGGGQDAKLNLAGHCNPSSGGCTGLSSEISDCQSKGIKILLSLGGDSTTYKLTNSDDASSVANYIWDNYFSGSGSGPLGSAVLDGIDLDIESGSTPDLYVDLVNTLKDLARADSKKLYISAAPGCSYPDSKLDSALLTPDLFDYVYVQFYGDDECDFMETMNAIIMGAPLTSFLLGIGGPLACPIRQSSWASLLLMMLLHLASYLAMILSLTCSLLSVVLLIMVASCSGLFIMIGRLLTLPTLVPLSDPHMGI